MPRLYDDHRSRNGYKVRLLLSHLGRPFEYVPVDILAGDSRRPEFLAKNPAGRIPVLELDDGRCLPESGAILCYLAEGTEFLPTEPFARAETLRWMFFEQNLVEPNLGAAILWRALGRDAREPETFANKMAAGREALGVLDRHLAARDWLAAGRFTVADVANYAYTRYAARKGIFDPAAFPAVGEWFARVEALPGHVGAEWGVTAAAEHTP